MKTVTKDAIFIFVIFYMDVESRLARPEILDTVRQLFSRNMDNWRNTVPENVYILDMFLAHEDKTRVDIICSNGSTSENEKLQNFISSLKKVLQSQIANISINDSKEFFGYETNAVG